MCTLQRLHIALMYANAACCASLMRSRAAGAWAAEVLGVLAPLVQRSQEAAEQLVTLGGLHALAALIKQPASEPLPLSLMLDIIEACTLAHAL